MTDPAGATVRDDRGSSPGDGPGLLCPSARCEEGALLLGVVGADGRIGYVSPLVPIDREFVDEARRGRPPERRFRFVQGCEEDGCAYWRHGGCEAIRPMVGLVDAVVDEAGRAVLPHCGIRHSCRWFAQEGPAACAVCPFIVTDLFDERDDPLAARAGSMEPSR